MKLSRRALLAASLPLAGAALAPWALRKPRTPIAGSIVGAGAQAGHVLRGTAPLPEPSAELEVPVAIYGGGIAGLSAAWKLSRVGFQDYHLFELEPEAGGTARHGQSAVTAYPWGAHYVPVPVPEAKAVVEMLTDLGAITGRDAQGRPIVDERYLCFAPQERIFVHGRWQEGLFPSVGATKADLRELADFRSKMKELRHRRDAQGRPAFGIPLERSSRDADLLALDTISMAEWLAAQGYRSPRLRWYVDYACRDDYGSTLENTSAWAGIFYYASRDPEGEGDEGQVMTWPEGNGWIVDRLAARAGKRLSASRLLCRVEARDGGAAADVLDVRTMRVTRVKSRAAILALPQFVLKKVAPGLHKETKDVFTYAPWVVANVAVDRVPEGRGAPPSWDNVIYKSDSLGYVLATHQHLSAHVAGSVLTWYKPLSSEDPAQARERMLQTPWEEWKRVVLDDLRRAHPGIESSVRQIDVMLWGHGMVRPRPGLIWGKERLQLAAMEGPLLPAHSDLSGLPLFEEANYRGVAAAEKALRALGVSFESSL